MQLLSPHGTFMHKGISRLDPKVKHSLLQSQHGLGSVPFCAFASKQAR